MIKRGLRVAIVSAVVGVLGVGVVLAEDIWVNRPFVDILSGKSSLYPTVARAEKGAQLTVIEHQGRWIHVQFNGKDGYVLEDAISASQVHTPQVLSDIKGSTSSGASAASSGKGFTPSEFASAKGLSEVPLKNLEATVQLVVTPQGLDRFMSDGRVGEDKPAPATQP